jgi:thioredoxin
MMNRNASIARQVISGTDTLRALTVVYGSTGWFIRMPLVLGLALCSGCHREPASIPQTEYVEYVNEANFAEKVLESPVPVLVDFYADWCEPCKKLAPVLDEIARTNPNTRIARVNVDKSPELVARYHINGVPSLMVFKNGKVVAQHAGAADKSQLESLLL